MADEQKLLEAAIRVAPDYSDRYSNYIAIESGLLDFRIRFGVCARPELGDDGPLQVEHFQGILLSPQEARVLSTLLNNELRCYEECYGPLPKIKPAAPVETSDETVAAAASEIIQ